MASLDRTYQATRTLIDSLPLDLRERKRHLSAMTAIVNAAARDNLRDLHVDQIGDGHCPAPRCDVH